MHCLNEAVLERPPAPSSPSRLSQPHLEVCSVSIAGGTGPALAGELGMGLLSLSATR